MENASGPNSFRLDAQSGVTKIEETDQIYPESSDGTDGYLFRTQVTISVPPSDAAMSSSDDDDETTKKPAGCVLRDACSLNSTHYQCQFVRGKENASLGPFGGCLVASEDEAADFDKGSEPQFSWPDLTPHYQKNWEAVKSQEISRLKDEIQAVKEDRSKLTDTLSEAQDTVAHLQEQQLVLRTEMDGLRHRAEWSDALVNSLQQKLALERTRASGTEEAASQVKKDHRRLEREMDFLKSDLAAAELEMKGFKLACTRLQNELRDSKSLLLQESNRIFTLKDEKELLSKENAHLRANLEAANQETRRVRHENNKLQDKIQSFNVSRQNLQMQMHSLQGQYSKELNSLSRQLHVAKEQANVGKIHEANSGECSDLELRKELFDVRRRYEELKKVVQMQQISGSVRKTVRSRSSVRSVVSTTKDSHEDVEDFVRHLHKENQLLKMNMKAAANLIDDE